MHAYVLPFATGIASGRRHRRRRMRPQAHEIGAAMTPARHPHRMAPLRRWPYAAVLVVALAATAGCAGAPAPGVDTPGPVDPSVAAGCVVDVPAVISRAAAPGAATASLPDDLVAKLDAAAAKGFAQAATPGAVVAVRTGEGTWMTALGDADPDAGTPMEPGVHTRIGSVTKTFTGTLLMQLVEQGSLSLDDPIEDYVPGVPNGDRITLRQLADMTSGVASYTRSTAFTDVYFARPETVFTPERLLEVGVAESPLFEPGAQFDYSNTNTVLLGMVIEKVTERPVEDVLEEQILEPLGMANTLWPGDSTEMPEPFAQGFTLQGDYATPDEPSNATHWNPAWGWTAGQLISNVDDLLVYGRALGTGQGLLNEKSQTERLTSFPGQAGYGIAMGCVDGWVGHTGELPGYNTSLYYDTTTDTTIVVQANSDIPSGDCAEDVMTLTGNTTDLPCSSPATRIFLSLTEALDHPFVMP